MSNPFKKNIFFFNLQIKISKNQIMSKLVKTIVMLLPFLIISCTSLRKNRVEIKEQNTKQFFEQWYAESQQILSENKAKGELQKNINEILALFLSKNKKVDFKKRFPKLEYQILHENIKVSMYKKLGETPKDEDLIFSEIDFKHSLNYDNSNKKILIFTPRYEKILQKKLPYGFADQTQKQNKNARAMLVKMGENFNYDIPAQIYISFNQELNSAIVYRYRKSSFGKPYWFRFHKENNQWKYNGINFNIRIS